MPTPPLQVNGVRTCDGDGTVPPISLGLMPRKAWLTAKLNPSQSTIVTREYTNSVNSGWLAQVREWVPKLMGTSYGRSDHVAVARNRGVVLDVMRVVAGHQLDNMVVSTIDSIVARVQLPS